MELNNSVKIFSDERFGTIRTAGTSDNPLFCLTDVCCILSLDSSQVMKRLDNGVVTVHPITDSMGRTQNANFINEDGLYDVILDSRKPQAKLFRKWVTSEVLPSIRKTGSYNMPNFSNPAEAARAWADQYERSLALEAKNMELQPKAKYFDDLVDRKLNINFRDTAKEIGLKQNDFIKRLIDAKYVYRDAKGQLKPYAAYVGSLFIIKECKGGEKWAGNQTLVTPKGRETFSLLYGDKK